jgi:hypothetical protein
MATVVNGRDTDDNRGCSKFRQMRRLRYGHSREEIAVWPQSHLEGILVTTKIGQI